MTAANIMADYVPVNERIGEFLEKYPEGSLQSEIVELSETRVVVRAYAYRSPDDPKPGMGHSSLTIPGKTTFTRDSEIENCETSAWGRAIAALGFEVKRGIASAEEVRNKTADAPARPPTTVQRPTVVRDDDLLNEIDEEDLANLRGATESTCSIHGTAWIGDPGDQYHRKPEGGYCRHPDNVKRPARAR